MLSQEQKDQLRQQLLEERERLSADNLDPDQLKYDNNSGVGNHPAEDASLVYEQEAIVGLRRNNEMTLNLVEHALQRMVNGTYGRCERCGKEISFERLEAIPYTNLDVECQQLMETKAT